MSARPRMTSSNGRNSTCQISRKIQHETSRSGAGLRRKRQVGEIPVNARTRAVYHDVGRTSSGGPSGMKNMPNSVSAASVVHTKFKIFQQAELHDEYFKLVDVVTELKAACHIEQAARMKAMARVRRLEEIVAMKDKKIESLLQKAELGATCSAINGATHRDLAHKDRQNQSVIHKLQLKIAQQSQLVASYEDAMQALRSNVKSTNVMQLEEERNQLYIELQHFQEKIARQRMEINSQERKITDLQNLDKIIRQQLAKVQQEHKRTQSEKQKAEQEIALLKSNVEQLQGNVILLQRKRAYDREVASNAHNQRGLTPSRSAILSRALEELKHVARKESSTPVASVQRERMKALSTAKPSAPKSISSSNPTPPTVKVQSATAPALRIVRPANAGPTRQHRVVASNSPSSVDEHCSPKSEDTLQTNPIELVDFGTSDKVLACDELKQELLAHTSRGDGDRIQGKIRTKDTVNDSVVEVTIFDENAQECGNWCVNDSEQSAVSTDFVRSNAKNYTIGEANTLSLERENTALADSIKEIAASDQVTTSELSVVSSLEALQRKEIADIEKLLRDMDAAGSGMLDSASSDEFLEDAESQFATLDRPALAVDVDTREHEDEAEDDDPIAGTDLGQRYVPGVTFEYDQRYESDFTETNDNDYTAEEEVDGDTML